MVPEGGGSSADPSLLPKQLLRLAGFTAVILRPPGANPQLLGWRGPNPVQHMQPASLLPRVLGVIS